MTKARTGRMGPRLALMSLAICLAAINTGNNLLYLVLSLLLAMTGLSAAAARLSLRGLRVSAHMPDQVKRGEPFLVAASVEGRFPLLARAWVDISIDGLPSPVEIPVPVSRGETRGVATGRATASRRGVFDGFLVTAATGYPLNLWHHKTRQECTASLVVLPGFTALRTLRIPRGFESGCGAQARADRGGGPGEELRNIRERTSHDDARHIDWRSSARTGKLMIKEFEREEDRRIDLVLDVEATDAESFEAVVERCAAIIDYADRRGLQARLLIPGHGQPLAGRAGMRALAEVQPSAPGQAPEALDVTLLRAGGGADVVVLSCDTSRSTPIEAT